MSWITYPRHTIAERTDIEIPPNKRNYRKQKLHLRIARSNLAILNEDAGHALQGRPNKRDAVLAYRAEHPDATQREIAAALGMSKTTVNKWLKAGE